MYVLEFGGMARDFKHCGKYYVLKMVGTVPSEDPWTFFYNKNPRMNKISHAFDGEAQIIRALNMSSEQSIQAMYQNRYTVNSIISSRLGSNELATLPIEDDNTRKCS